MIKDSTEEKLELKKENKPSTAVFKRNALEKFQIMWIHLHMQTEHTSHRHRGDNNDLIRVFFVVCYNIIYKK